MSKTKISWCDETINPVTGCTPVSEGCAKCYAASIAKRFWGERKFSDIQFNPARLNQIEKMRKPKRIFMDSMGDLFHDGVSIFWIRKILLTCASTRRIGHKFLFLTKRAERMQSVLQGLINIGTTFHEGCTGRLPSFFHFGITAENQARLDERIPHLMKCPAAVNFVSLEPLLGEIVFEDDWTRHGTCPECEGEVRVDEDGCCVSCGSDTELIYTIAPDWVIVGAETGPGRRPCKLEWIKSIVRQCKDAGVPVFVKSFVDERGKVVKDPNRFPDSIRFREFPS